MNHAFEDESIALMEGSLLSVKINCLENSDWDFARNKRSTLLVPCGEWTQGCASSIRRLEDSGFQVLAPNRDSPYEGVYAYSSGENWKFLDTIYLAFQYDDGSFVNFAINNRASSVICNPWRVTYHYVLEIQDNELANRRDDLVISIAYTCYLCSSPQDDIVIGCFELQALEGLSFANGTIRPVLIPYFDIRHMYEEAFLDRYTWNSGKYDGSSYVDTANCSKRVRLYTPDFETEILSQVELLSCQYRYGSGDRTEVPVGDGSRRRLRFIPKHHQTVSKFRANLPFGYNRSHARVYICCGEDRYVRQRSLNEIKSVLATSIIDDRNLGEEVSRFCPSVAPQYKEAIHGRIVGWTKYYLSLTPEALKEHFLIPSAGGWWFRTPWFRDVFEGINSSFETMSCLPGGLNNTKNIALAALKHINQESGCIPNKFPEYKGIPIPFNSSDATLLAYIVGFKSAQRLNDLDLMQLLLAYLDCTLNAFSKEKATNVESKVVDAGPRIDSTTGLLLTVPCHSWIDTSTQKVKNINFDLPNRFSNEFLTTFSKAINNDELLKLLLSSPNFYLPEINALWIEMLRCVQAALGQFLDSPNNVDMGMQYATLIQAIKRLLDQAQKNYPLIFWNETRNFLYNAIYVDKKHKDTIECETAITSLALAGDLFAESQLNDATKIVEKTLLIRRRLVQLGDQELPFGVKTKNEEPVIPFFGDGQYHSAVIWPRSTYYLIRLYERCKKPLTIEGLLVNALDHQMSEAAVFYSQELFSLPIGFDANPNPRTHDNPVPVKNPLQFWSQWCDPFLKRTLQDARMLAQQIQGGIAATIKGEPSYTSSTARSDNTRQEHANFSSTFPQAMINSMTIADCKNLLPLIFVSFASYDKAFVQKLETFIRPLERFMNRVSLFICYEDIRLGDIWHYRIMENIRKSRISVLVFSAEFFNSDYIQQYEIPNIRLRKEELGDGYIIMPIYWRECFFEKCGLGNYQMLTDGNGAPLFAVLTNTMREQRNYDILDHYLKRFTIELEQAVSRLK